MSKGKSSVATYGILSSQIVQAFLDDISQVVAGRITFGRMAAGNANYHQNRGPAPKGDLAKVTLEPARRYGRIMVGRHPRLYGFLDLTNGCVLRVADPVAGKPDPVPRGNLVDPDDQSHGRAALDLGGIRELSDYSLDPRMLANLRLTYAPNTIPGRKDRFYATVGALYPGRGTAEARGGRLDRSTTDLICGRLGGDLRYVVEHDTEISYEDEEDSGVYDGYDQIDSAWVTEPIDLDVIIDHMLRDITLPPAIAPFAIYALERILRHGGADKAHNYEVKWESDYYGDSVTEVALERGAFEKLAAQINALLANPTKPPTHERCVHAALIAEYGHLTNDVSSAGGWHIADVRPTDIVAPAEGRTSTSPDLVKSYSRRSRRPGPVGIAIEVNGKYKLVDGRHRVEALAAKPRIPLIVGR